MQKMKLHSLSFLLLIIGGLNWLMFGLIGWDISILLGGMSSVVSRTVYVLVGLSAIYELVSHKGLCKNCGMDSKGGK